MPPATKNRSGIFFFSIVSLLLVTSVWSRAGATAPLPPAEPSRDINSYVLFALSEINFKGRNANPSRGFIRGGNVGVNNPDPHGINHSPYAPVLSLGANGAVVTDDGSQVVADTVRLGDTTSVWNLFANEVQNSFNPVVLRDPPRTPFTAPIIAPADLPACPPFSPGTQNVTVPTGGSLVLAPGSYGDVRVQDNGTLTLGSGIYNFKSFNNGKKVRILTDPGTDVRVAEDMSTNDGSFVGPADCAHFCVRSDNVSHNDATVSFGRNTEIHGQFYAPNGRINLGHSTDLFGRFWSDTVSSDFNVNITMGCATQTCFSIKSGNGVICNPDTEVQFFDTTSSSYVPALVVDVNILFNVYDTIPGTQWNALNCLRLGPDNTDFLYRTFFTLPASFSSPSLSVQVHCDNVAEIFVNGTSIGSQPFAEVASNFQDPPEVFSTANAALFQPGANELSFKVHNFGAGITALDFKADICTSTSPGKRQ